MKIILPQMAAGGGGHKYHFHFLFWHQNALAYGKYFNKLLIFC